MKIQGKFILLSLEEFEKYINNLNISGLRHVDHVQTHHTWSPSYRNFNGSNHFDKLTSMEEAHKARGFSEIAQHYTTFPDGSIAVCRTLTIIPACIKGHNTGGICIENLGNFDAGQDQLTEEHKNTIIKMNALLCLKFGLPVNTDTIVYHHWFRLNDGFRDNGVDDPELKDHKTCPGTGFFGGNTVEKATANYLPLIQAAYDEYKNNPVAAAPSSFKTGVVNASVLNVRNGPGTEYNVVDQLHNEARVTILESNNGWDKIGDNRWVSSDYIALN
jgi:hypothetical protein